LAYALIPGIIGLIAYIGLQSFGPRKNGVIAAIAMGALLIAHFSPLAVRWLLRSRIAESEQEEADEALTRSAIRIGSALQMPLTSARIRRSEAARRYITFALERGVLTVSQKAAEILSPREMDYAIAYSTALNDQARRLVVVALAFPVPMALLMFFVLRDHDHLRQAWKLGTLFGVMLAMIGSSAAFALWMKRRIRLGAMKRALQVTNELAAARSAHYSMIEFEAGNEDAPSRVQQLQAEAGALLDCAAGEVGLA
jgi:hypothetical protein